MRVVEDDTKTEDAIPYWKINDFVGFPGFSWVWVLCTISGQYDLMAMVTESTTEALDRVIDSIAALDGVEKTLSHIVLSRKKDRVS